MPRQKYFFCDPGFKMYRYPDYLEFSHRNMAEMEKKINLKKPSMSRQKEMSNAQFGQVASKKL